VRPANNLQVNLSGIGFWIATIAIIWLLGAIGLGWLVKSFFIVIGLLLLAPVVAVLGFRWWLKRNLVEGKCPVCSGPVAGFKTMSLACPSCGEPLTVSDGTVQRVTPPGTVDVAVVDVDGVDVIDVSVKQLED
jgi:endogenous inhibitor of DNA gyrase (YacG/DUF329 family)